jgi:hypothetical protein
MAAYSGCVSCNEVHCSAILFWYWCYKWTRSYAPYKCSRHLAVSLLNRKTRVDSLSLSVAAKTDCGYDTCIYFFKV